VQPERFAEACLVEGYGIYHKQYIFFNSLKSKLIKPHLSLRSCSKDEIFELIYQVFHPLSTPMVVRSLDVKKDPYRPRKNNEKALGPEVPYLSAIGALMYLANNTRPDISFSLNVLARYSSDPTRRHWNKIKYVLRYLCGTRDMGLFYQKNTKSKLVGYADAGYLSDPHKARSQSGYVFTCGGVVCTLVYFYIVNPNLILVHGLYIFVSLYISYIVTGQC
jgi:hypothetical protein